MTRPDRGVAPEPDLGTNLGTRAKGGEGGVEAIHMRKTG